MALDKNLFIFILIVSIQKVCGKLQVFNQYLTNEKKKKKDSVNPSEEDILPSIKAL